MPHGGIPLRRFNVSQQYLVQNHSRVEFLGCIGAGGAICGVFQLFIFGNSEMEEIASLNIINILLLIAFVTLLFTMYSTTSFFLQYADAVLFNMSLLTSDVFGAILGYFFFSTRFSGLYLLSLAFIVGGVYFYGEGPQPVALPDGEGADEYRKVHDGLDDA